MIVGFGLLIKGADWFVEGSAQIASSLRVPPLLIGLTIVAFVTSSPEATVSIIAAINGSSNIALGNVIGSNIFNITLVIGVTALIAPLAVENETIRKEIPFMLLASVVLIVLMGDMFLDTLGSNIWNILFILGVSSVITPLQVDSRIFLDIIFMILLSALLLIFSRTHFKIDKTEGWVLVFVYLCYMVLVMIRN